MSGQEHASVICRGSGKRPFERSVMTCMTAVESLPCRSSTSDPMRPMQAAAIDFQRGGGSFVISIVTS
jgi:hypothetical protein